MRAKPIVARTVLAALIALPGVLSAAEFKLPASDATPAELVTAALRTELEGPSDQRNLLLEQALKLDPNYAPARWQSGYVRWDDQWLTLDEVAQRAGDDKRLDAYRQRRDAMIDTADAHRELARWCKKSQLFDESRVHWAKVLEFDAQGAEALTALGLQFHEGRLLTRQQIVEAKKLAGERLQAMRRWQPQMVKWRKALETGTGKDYEAAREALSKLDDVDAIGALEATFAENGTGKKADALNLALIETVGRMPTPEATQVLLRRALQPDSQAVRAAACDQLKKRPMYAYVPQMIAAIPGKIKTHFNIFVLPGGMVIHEHEVFLEGREADVLLTFTSSVNPADAITKMLVTPRALRNETFRAAQMEASASSVRDRQEWLRQRVQFVLKRTTGFEDADEPEMWDKLYNEHYHWGVANSTKPRYVRSSELNQAFVQAPRETNTTNTMRFTDPSRPPLVVLERAHGYCFPPGTQVTTIYGLRPIEKISAGDRVLSQDLLSGELLFESVQQRRLREVPELMRIELDGSNIIVATLGHPFWVVGKGWQVASQLEKGDSLHSLNGPIRVESVASTTPTEVYNLVVAGQHNYFVGDNRVLAHDNSPVMEPGTLIPGLSPPIAAR